MNWFWVSMGAIGGLLFLLTKGQRVKKRKAGRQSAAPKGLSAHDRVEAALTSGDVAHMESVLEKTDDPILRDSLLVQIVATYYRQRADADSRAAFYRYAGQQIEAAPVVLDAIEEIEAERPDRVEAFKMLAIAMDEDGRYDEAIAICKQALSLGLENGTKTGFEGRIARLEKKGDSGG